jgi:uncharacterized protein (TIGR03067 family)
MHKKWGRIIFLITAAASLAAEPDPSKKDLGALQGAWAVESLEYNGKQLKDKYKISFTCKDNVMTVAGDGKVRKEYAKLALKLDPTTMPKCVDITVIGGVQNDAKMEGIYEVKGDELRLCVKVFGGMERPAEFKSPEGSSIVLLTLKRRK